MAELSKEDQFIRLNKNIDMLMNAGCYDEAIESIEKAMKLCQLIATSSADFKKISLMKENYQRLGRKRDICNERLGNVEPAPTGNTGMAIKQMPKKTGANQQAKAAEKGKKKAEPAEKPTLEQALAELNALEGLAEVKEKVNTFVKQLQVFQERKARNLPVPDMSYHMVFTGNPGTGKTTVARIMGKIYAALGVVETGQLIEVDRSKLVAGYSGQTAIKSQEKVDEALGGVLFIDEAYTLKNDERDSFGQEAIETVLKGMEDHRSELVVIIAGYTNEITKFLGTNPGLSSRFKYYIDFADYNGKELYGIFARLCKKNGYTLDDGANQKVVEHLNYLYNTRGPNFGNGRDVRNFFENTVSKQAQRVVSIPGLSDDEYATITADDLAI